MGRIRSKYSRGMWIHPTIAVSPDRLCLGVIDLEVWTRNLEIKRIPSKINDRKNIETKESYKWIKSYQSSNAIAQECKNTQIINIADREADIMELLIEVSKQKQQDHFAHIIIRSSHDRISQDGKNLLEKLHAAPAVGALSFQIPSGRNRLPRKVCQTLKAITFCPRQKWFNGQYLDKIEINVVMAKENNPPPGTKGLEWIFLTTLFKTVKRNT